jgi:hypothetical protein
MAKAKQEEPELAKRPGAFPPSHCSAKPEDRVHDMGAELPKAEVKDEPKAEAEA